VTVFALVEVVFVEEEGLVLFLELIILETTKTNKTTIRIPMAAKMAILGMFDFIIGDIPAGTMLGATETGGGGTPNEAIGEGV
jgi:hypothetical protein